MNTLDFLGRVLPTEGQYVALVIETGRFTKQRFFSSVSDLVNYIRNTTSKNRDVYYALSSFKDNTSRKRVNALYTRALFLDLDCGYDKDGEQKDYLTQKEALTSLAAFLKKSGMPKPTVVNSGTGIHVYWPFKEHIPSEEWRVMADIFKQMTVDLGMKTDPVVTADNSRVLRPSDTFNSKNGATVSVLMESDSYDVQDIRNILLKHRPSGEISDPATLPAPSRANPPMRGHQGIMDDLEITNDFPPAVPHLVAKGCAQVAWAIANPKKVKEPMWYGLLGIAAFCVDADNTAQDWSKGHPDYNAAQTLKKLKQWQTNTTGPTTCAKLREFRPKGCAGCVFRDKIKTPVHISVQHEAAPDIPDVPQDVPVELPLPKGFRRAKVKGKAGIVQTIEGTEVAICDFDIYPIGYGYDESRGYETVRYKWYRNHVGWRELAFRQAFLTDDHREFAVALADQGIVLEGKVKTQVFQFMLRSYMDNLRHVQSMTNLYNTMGWKNNHTEFVVGDRVYKRGSDGVTCEELRLAGGISRYTDSMFTRSGNVENWVRASGLLEQHKLYAHMFAVMQGLAAPLWSLLELHGAVVSLTGDTGCGKTVAQLIQQSIWGHPSKLLFNAKTTPSALYSRLAMLSSLPFAVDEATLMPDRDAADLCFTMSLGRDKARLNRAAEERVPKEWATVTTVSTNQPFENKIMNYGGETSAPLARLLEFSLVKHPMFAEGSKSGRKIVEHFTKHHGWVGDLLIREYLRIGPDGLREMIEQAYADFPKKYKVKFYGEERFHEALLVLTDVAGQIAESIGLLGFDYRLCIEEAVRNMECTRKGLDESQRTAFDMIDEFIMAHRDQILVVMHTDKMAVVDTTSQPRAEIAARIDLYRPSAILDWDSGTIMMAKTPLRQWLSERTYDFNKFTRELHTHGLIITPPSGRFSMGRDTGIKNIGQARVVGVNLMHDALRHLLEQYNEGPDEIDLPGGT